MNKLGFYIENTTVPFLREALREVKPPTILIHAGDRGLLQEIRRDLSPDSFVVGRMFVPLSEQEAWLNDPDPAGRGRTFADQILNYDMGLATERGGNGRLLIDAWMVLNEALRGPASFPDGRPDAETLRRAEALDRLQLAFHERLAERGIEAVAFNFGAGNFTHPDHYLNLFPRTLDSYTYLGFHEYGWPTLTPNAGSSTAALLYRRCMEGIRNRYGGRHRAIITEAGLARMYKYPADGAGDVGWLYPADSIPEEQYWDSLRWYNGEMLKDGYTLGACMFSVGHSGRWETFRVLGNDNAGRPILLMSRIATLGASAPMPAPTPAPVPAPTPEPKPKPEPATPLPPSAPAPDPALGKRLADVVTYLKLTVQQIEQWESLHAQIAAQIAALQDALHEGPDAFQLKVLQQQLDHLQALLTGYAANPNAITYPPDLAALKWRVSRLRRQAEQIDREIEKAAGLRAECDALAADFAALDASYKTIPALRQRAEQMLAEAQTLGTKLSPPARTPYHDARAGGATENGQDFAARDAADIHWIIIHHAPEVGVEDVEQPARTGGIAESVAALYHFYIAADGATYQTQDLTALIEHIGLHGVDVASIAVALAGQFDADTPSAAQMDALADLAGWLMAHYGLGADAILGASEVKPGATSPGAQWLQGYQYKLALLDRLAEHTTRVPAI